MNLNLSVWSVSIRNWTGRAMSPIYTQTSPPHHLWPTTATLTTVRPTTTLPISFTSRHYLHHLLHHAWLPARVIFYVVNPDAWWHRGWWHRGWLVCAVMVLAGVGSDVQWRRWCTWWRDVWWLLWVWEKGVFYNKKKILQFYFFLL